MARPRKETVDYFPHFAGKGKTLFVVESEFENDGYAFWFKLLELLCTSKGMFYDCKNPADYRFMLAKTSASKETAEKILHILCELEAIDAELWQKERIIWVQNLVDNVEDVFKRRSSSKPQKPKIGINVCNNPAEVELLHTETPTNNENGDVSANNNPQTKLNEIKSNKKDSSREIENFRQRYSDFIDLVDEYLDILRTTRVSGKISDNIILKLYQEMEKYPVIVVKAAVLTIIRNPALHSKRENYFYGILRNTKADAAAEKLRKYEAEQAAEPVKPNPEYQRLKELVNGGSEGV